MIEQEEEPVHLEKSENDGQKHFLNELRITNMQKEASFEKFKTCFKCWKHFCKE